MKIAIIGSGHIGGGLGRAWAKKRHEVVFGARDAKEADLAALCKEIGASAAEIGPACAGADVVVFAMPFGAIDDVLKAAGDLAGKTVIDCTNAVEWATKSLKYGHTTSA